MATTVQIINYTAENHRLELTNGVTTNLPPGLRPASGSTIVNQAKTVDIALLTNNGQRELKRLLASGSIIILASGSLS